MMTLTRLLTVGSMALPQEHRARWREEALAVLLAVRGPRRWRYTLDTVLKAPLLAYQHQRTAHPDAPAPWVSVLAGAGLLCVPAFAAAVLTVGELIWQGAAVFLLIAPIGLLPAVAARSFATAARRGGGSRYAAALLVTLFVGAGPIAAQMFAVTGGSPVLASIGEVAPGLWLAHLGITALRRRIGPANEAILGTVAGTALVVVPIGCQFVSQLPGVALASLLLLALMLTPTYLAWSVLAGLRTLAGRRELITG